MANEPEKKIEESLHAYARKRREDAGDLEMHPATRRILQGEVAKLAKSNPPADAHPWWHSLFLAWPKLAAAVGTVAVLAVGVWVFTQSETQKLNEATELASRPPAEVRAIEDLAQAKDKSEALAELDGVAEEAKKKLDRKELSRLAVADSERSQSRDAVNAPATLMPTAPAPTRVLSDTREKDVKLQYQLPAQQPVTTGDTLSLAENQKRGDFDNKDALLKQNAGERNRALYREDTLAKERLGAEIVGSTAITAGVDLAAGYKLADTYAYDTNTVASFGVNIAQNRFSLPPTNQITAFDVATFSTGFLQPTSTIIVATTEWAAPRAEPAKNETYWLRDLQNVNAVAGAAIAVGQEYERQDTSGARVLQRFAVEQLNRRITIRDADGSVYEGDILSADLRSYSKSVELKDEVREVMRNPATPISFRASGTNKLKQRVVINGEILSEEEQFGRVLQAGKAASAPAPVDPATGLPPQAPPQSKARRQAEEPRAAGAVASDSRASNVSTSAPAFVPTTIRGRLQVGTTNEINFRALRTR